MGKIVKLSPFRYPCVEVAIVTVSYQASLQPFSLDS